jgi:hypothetical protein
MPSGTNRKPLRLSPDDGRESAPGCEVSFEGGSPRSRPAFDGDLVRTLGTHRAVAEDHNFALAWPQKAQGNRNAARIVVGDSAEIPVGAVPAGDHDELARIPTPFSRP